LSPLLLVSLPPLVLAVLGLTPSPTARLSRRWPRLAGLRSHGADLLPRLGALLLVVELVLMALICRPALLSQRVVPLAGGFAVDGLAAGFLLLTAGTVAAAAIQAAFLLPAEQHTAHRVSDRRLGMFYTLTALFLLSMIAVLTAQDLGYLWIAMEATTLMSAPLVYYHRSQNSLEATWKYLLLCSVGIAFALFGTVLLFAASQRTGDENGTLAIAGLLARAPALDPRLLRLSFVFCLLGYGTKAGLFPLHNWLPDAHSEAPAPASAMLSGALLNCALVALWRISRIMVAAGHGAVVQQTMIPMGALTVLVASLILVRQHDLKRMWAYSSVEHVGLMTLAIGLGSGSLFLLHAVNHSLVKNALFLLSGNILYLYGTKSLGKLAGLLKAAPGGALLLALAGFAVAGSPPFGTFVSEWLILRNLLASGQGWAAGLVIAGLTLTFVAVASHVARILFGAAPALPVKLPPRSWLLVPAALIGLSLLAGTMVSPRVLSMLNALAPGAGVR
jgi:hydrogenase-4 component F